jgi:molybdopterin synthase sulfur carrier subunit
MAVTVRIPTPLRTLTRNEKEVQIAATSVSELLAGLEQAHPGFRERLLDESGKLRRFVNIFVNDEDIRFLQNLDTKLKDGDQVSIVPAIAGGR